MTTSPRTPRIVKGALVALDIFNPVSRVVVFQYNPTSLTRSLEANAASGSGDQREALRLKGPPRESISLKAELDATDQLETGTGPATKLGVHPALASLEMMLYPSSALVIANQALAFAGMIEVVPPEAPLTLLVWGAKRVLPVRVTGFSVTEEAFDTNLNPIQATVDLAFDVLNYNDLGFDSPGGMHFMAHQVTKEVMATINGLGTLVGDQTGAVNVG